MRIINLVENTEGRPGCIAEHGLSFYIETGRHRVLSDIGASDAAIRNAALLGIDLKSIDTLILSHGHYDHGGGIPAFAELNPDAKIYLQKSALGAYYSVTHSPEPKYIGLDKSVAALPQLVYLDGDLEIDDELFVFGNVCGRRLWPDGNRQLLELKKTEMVQDSFQHEQYLVVRQRGKRILASGCAHNGILNILDRFREVCGGEPDAVISGFHMMRRGEYTEQDLMNAKKTAGELRKLSTHFYTGHCTGEVPFAVMKEIMGDQLHYVHCGEEIDLSGLGLE